MSLPRLHSGRSALPALLIVALAPWAGAGAERASAEVRGESVAYRSPNGVRESCVLLARMPGARYRAQDDAQKRALCAIDFHQPTHALCPKLFSTSPGAMVYDLSAGPYAGRQDGADYTGNAAVDAPQSRHFSPVVAPLWSPRHAFELAMFDGEPVSR